MAKRPSWTHYFMTIAHTVATRSTCDRRHVGAVLVRDKHILSTGYNGAPRGLKHCDEVGHLMRDGHCVRTSHAEMNAIASAAMHGTAIDGASLYCTDKPCLGCTKLLINAGVKHIVYDRHYDSPEADTMLEAAGISLEQFQVETSNAGTPPS